MRRQTQTVQLFRSFIYSFPTQQDCVLPVVEGEGTRWVRHLERRPRSQVLFCWSEAVTAARDRAGVRRQVNDPILPEET